MKFYKILFLLSVLFYIFTRIINLEIYPIYFFADEAIQAVKAEEILISGGKDRNGSYLPMAITGFNAGNMLGLSIHFNIPGVLIFGKHVWSVRLTTIIFSLIGSLFTVLTLKNIFKLKNYWAAIMFLAINPIFFIHSRTGFETAISTSFFAGFLYFYLLFLDTKKILWGALSITMAAVAAYTYAGIWLTVFIAIVFFVITDIRFYLSSIRKSLLLMFFSLFIFIPLLITQINNRNRLVEVIKNRDSYLVENYTILQKINLFFQKYSYTLNPQFLFLHEPTDEPRHYVKGYTFFPIWSLPLVLIGFFYSIFNIKKRKYQICLLSFIFSTLGGSIVNKPAVTRIMPVVIPITFFFGLGCLYIENSLNKKRGIPVLISSLFFIFCLVYGSYFTKYALTKDPLLHPDYGLYGMQFGAMQLFSQVDESLNTYENAFVSADFANGTDIFVPFFLNKKKTGRAFVLGAFDDLKYINRLKKSNNSIYFSMPSQYDNLKTLGLFSDMPIRYTILAPNGKPAFYGYELYWNIY